MSAKTITFVPRRKGGDTPLVIKLPTRKPRKQAPPDIGRSLLFCL